MTVSRFRLRILQPWLFESRSLIIFAWPILVTSLVQSGMVTLDLFMISHLGKSALAAFAVGSSVYFVLMTFGTGLMFSVAPLIGRRLGENTAAAHAPIRGIVHSGMFLAILISTPIGLILWHSEDIHLALGQDPAVSELASSYVRAQQWSILPYYAFSILRTLSAAVRRTSITIAIVLAALLTKALLNYCFIDGHFSFPQWGLAGAGVATTGASASMFLAMATAFSLDSELRKFRVFAARARLSLTEIGQLLKIGLPIGGMMVVEVGVFNASAFLLGLISPDDIAAHAIASRIVLLTFLVPQALSLAVTLHVAMAKGAGDGKGVQRAGWTACLLIAAFLLTIFALIFTFIEPILGLFLTGTATDEVYQLALSFLLIAGFFQFFDGMQVVFVGMLRGLGDTTGPLIIATIGYWIIGLPAGLILAFLLGMNGAGIWIGMTIGVAAVAALQLCRWVMACREVLAVSGARLSN